MNNLKPISFLFLLSLLTACMHPPYNNYKRYNKTTRYTAATAAAGTVIGAAAGATGIGAAAGGLAGLVRGGYLESRPGLVRELSKASIQVEEQDDTLTLIVPTDKYFVFDAYELNDLRYEALNNIVRLLKTYPKGQIYVAGFTDNVGSKKHKQLLSQNRALALMSFLWAKGIPARELNAEGYADKHDIANNQIIHGSAMNRRVEIQWRAYHPRFALPFKGKGSISKHYS